jgi:cell division protein FtsB
MTLPSTDRDAPWSVTLAFWTTLLTAGGVLAAVALAPKLKTLGELQTEYAQNQLRLVELERRANDLERVAEALERDPAFSSELAKLEFAAARPGEEYIAVPRELQLGADARPTPQPDHLQPPRWPVPRTLLDTLATKSHFRAALLTIASLLVLVAFLILHEEHAALLRMSAKRAKKCAAAIALRYRKL